MILDELVEILFFVAFLPIGVAWIWGIHCLFSEGYILEKVGNVIESQLPNWITHPLFICPMCMASIHGTLIFWLFMIGSVSPMFWPLYCVSLCGINFIITKLIEKNELDN